MENEIRYINMDDIIPNRYQPREVFDEKALNELAESIRQHGVLQPILVRPISNKFEIIAGERRYKASAIAGKTKIPAIVKEMDDKESAIVAFIENAQRKDVSAIEEAKVASRILKDNNMTQEELASTLGISQSTLANKLRLLALPLEVQEALMKNEISERHARSLLSVKETEKQIELLRKIKENRMTVRELDGEIKSMYNENNFNVNMSQNNGVLENNTQNMFINSNQGINNEQQSSVSKNQNDFMNFLNNYDNTVTPSTPNMNNQVQETNQGDTGFMNFLNNYDNTVTPATPNMNNQVQETNQGDTGFTNFLNNYDNTVTPATPNMNNQVQETNQGDTGFMNFLNNYDNTVTPATQNMNNQVQETNQGDTGFTNFLNNYDNTVTPATPNMNNQVQETNQDDTGFMNYLNNYDNTVTPATPNMNNQVQETNQGDTGFMNFLNNYENHPNESMGNNVVINDVNPPITSNFDPNSYIEDNPNYVDVSNIKQINSVDDIINDLKSNIDRIKAESKFKIETDEVNFDDLYQITIKIDKRDF